MMYAANTDGVRILATPGATAACPLCASAVLAKCGRLVSWHWAHTVGHDCDPWSDGESEWHRAWKEAFPESFRESVIGRHRADLLLANGVVVELQHSSISPDEIWEREAFYGRMCWVFDVREAVTKHRLLLRDRGSFVSFRWLHARKTIAHARKPVFLDIGNRLLLRLHLMGKEAPTGGWGYLKPAHEVFGPHGYAAPPGDSVAHWRRREAARWRLNSVALRGNEAEEAEARSVLAALGTIT